MKLTSREKFLLILLLIVIIGALYYTLFYKPYNEKLVSVQDEMSELNEKIASHQFKAATLTRLKENVEKLEKEVTEYIEGKNINSGYNPAMILVYIEKLLSDFNAQQLSVELSEPVIDEFYRSATINIVFEADYKNTKEIINKIENGEFKQYINNINVDYIKSNEERENGDKLSVAVTFTHIFDVAGNRTEDDYPFMQNGKFNKENPFK